MVDFLADLERRGRAATASTTGPSLDQLVVWLRGRKDPIDLLRATADDLAAFQRWLVTVHRTPKGERLARTTCATRLAQIRSFYRWCHRRGHLAMDPSRNLGLVVPRSRVVVRDHLTLQEATALIRTQAAIAQGAAPGSRRRAEGLRNLSILCLAVASGRRVGGIRGLVVADVDLERHELRVAREKGHSQRVLPLAEWATSVIALYLREARPLLAAGHDAPWLFLNPAGDGPITRDALRWMLAQVVQRTVAERRDLPGLAEKTISFHSLRVSFATLLFRGGCDIRAVNELLLHRSLSTTARYTPVPVEDLRRVFRTAHPRP